jgi:hypothetical protein
MDAPGIIAAILGEQLPNISLESIRNVVLTSGLLLSLIGSIYFKKLQRFRLTYVLCAVSVTLLAIYFIITTLLEGIYITLLFLGLATFSAGFNICLEPSTSHSEGANLRNSAAYHCRIDSNAFLRIFA